MPELKFERTNLEIGDWLVRPANASSSLPSRWRITSFDTPQRIGGRCQNELDRGPNTHFKVVRLSKPWKDCEPNDDGILEADIIQIGNLTVYLETRCESALRQLVPIAELP